ncbi:MAG TPA: type IV pilus assembly protein PilM [Catenuloplanes sp.]|jgi:type IV pilus assembly protein PilM
MAASTLIGLDIGAMSIRAVETRRGKDGQSLTAFGQAPLPAGAVQAGVITDDKAVTSVLKQLWAANTFRSRQVVLGVTNPQIVVREMSVSNLPPRELRASLPFQVRDVLPLPVEKSLLDFYPLEDPGTNTTVRGLLIAAPKDPVMTAVQAVQRAGLHVTRVDLASFALLRAASQLDSQVEALVDIGAQSTSVVVHTDGNPLIVRTVPRGGTEITEKIATRLRISAAEAEALKCRVGLLPDRDPDTAEAIDDAVRPLINELRSSFTYLASGERQSRVTRVALSGGGSLLPGLPDVIAEQLDVTAVIADPVMRLRDVRRGKRDELSRFRSSAAVSIGLTLGAAA